MRGLNFPHRRRVRVYCIRVSLRLNSHGLNWPVWRVKFRVGFLHILTLTQLQSQSLYITTSGPSPFFLPSPKQHWSTFCLRICLLWTFHINESHGAASTAIFHLGWCFQVSSVLNCVFLPQPLLLNDTVLCGYVVLSVDGFGLSHFFRC